MVAAGAFAVAACGDDGGGQADARRFDAPNNPDGPEPDGPPAANIIGQLSILESTVYVPGLGEFGQGPSFRMAFTDPALTGGPTMEEQPGSPFGCKAFEYSPAEYAATLGADLGTIDLTFTNGPVVPTCSFIAGAGYLCPDPTTANNGDNAVLAAGPTATTRTYTDPDANYTTDVNGRYLQISGATSAANNGTFPIALRASATTLVIANPVGVNEIVGGTSITIAGVGPIPSAGDPGFIADNATMDVTFTSSDTVAFPNFTGSLADFANDFTLNAASIGLLSSIPTDGSEFTLDCEPGMCGDALSSVLNVLTTDGDTTGLSGFTMPPPATRAVLVRCTSVIGAGDSVTVPAAYSAFIMNSGATRIQATFVRGSLVTNTGLPQSRLVVVGGHSAVGFTNPSN